MSNCRLIFHCFITQIPGWCADARPDGLLTRYLLTDHLLCLLSVVHFVSAVEILETSTPVVTSSTSSYPSGMLDAYRNLMTAFSYVTQINGSFYLIFCKIIKCICPIFLTRTSILAVSKATCIPSGCIIHHDMFLVGTSHTLLPSGRIFTLTNTSSLESLVSFRPSGR